MFKRILVMATLVCALPAMANAWSLNTWAKSGGGNIAVRGGAAQTSAQGSVFNSYTTTNTVAVAVTAAPGYTISKVTQNGVVTTGPVSPYNTTVAGPTAQSVFATFKANMVSVTANCGTGASVSPRSLGNIYYGQTALAAIKFVFTPKAGFAVGAINQGTNTFVVSAPNATTGSVSVTIPKGFVFTAPVALSASPNATSPVANAGAPQTIVLPAGTVTLNGAASTGTITTYTWSQIGTSPAAVTLTQPVSTTKATFTPTVAGTYTFTLTVDGGSTSTTSVTVTTSAAAAARNACANCHIANAVDNGTYANWSSSIHSRSTHSICSACHVGTNSGGHPGSVTSGTVDPVTFVTKVAGVNGTLAQGVVFCSYCHSPLHLTTGLNKTCAACHMAGGDAHTVQALPGCVDCHAVPVANLAPSLVNDNNGVRAIMPEFQKTSHHIVNADGSAPTNAQCAVCHLEGQVAWGSLGVNSATHMVDGKIHLRDGGGVNFTTVDDHVSKATTVGGKSQFAWDPANPDHRLMDQFCMSCHNANGAPAAVAALGSALPGMTATNPFADAIKNNVDGMSRSAVIDVFTAFDTNNSSHHAVRGQKYSGRTRAQAEANYPGAFTQYSGAAVNPRSSGADTNANAGIGPKSPGSRYTIYEAGYFVSNYTPLGATATVADDSTLHCGDCHTVGQFKPGSTTAVQAQTDGTTTVVTGLAAIGAHGSVNEYMLRTSDGVDALHHQTTNVVQETALPHGTGFVPPTDGTYVCFLCHNQRVYGAEEYLPYKANPPAGVTFAVGRLGGHGGMHPCNDDVHGESVGLTGSARVASHEDGEWGGGNLYGYTCGHCHNSGNKGFGGIHGGNATWGTYSASQGYASATNNTPTINYRTSYRFMGGLSLRYNGGGTAAKWESQTLQKSNREGCYNFTSARPTTGVTPSTTFPRAALTAAKNEWAVDSAGQATEFTDGTTANAMYGTWGACSHHNGSSTAGSGNTANRKVQRPLQY